MSLPLKSDLRLKWEVMAVTQDKFDQFFLTSPLPVDILSRDCFSHGCQWQKMISHYECQMKNFWIFFFLNVHHDSHPPSQSLNVNFILSIPDESR